MYYCIFIIMHKFYVLCGTVWILTPADFLLDRLEPWTILLSSRSLCKTSVCDSVIGKLPKFKAFPLLQSLFSGVATLKIAVPCNNMDCIMYNYVSTFIGNVVLSGEQPCLKHLKITASPLVLSKTLVSLAELLTPTTHTRSPRQPHLKVSQWNPQTSMTSATRAIH